MFVPLRDPFIRIRHADRRRASLSTSSLSPEGCEHSDQFSLHRWLGQPKKGQQKSRRLGHASH